MFFVFIKSLPEVFLQIQSKKKAELESTHTEMRLAVYV